ncbi:MAG: trehalose-phosphatase [Candidatus Sulfotelmatobacter sp.]
MLAPHAKPKVESLLQAVVRAPQSLLMLDYDGTLAPFRKDPEQAFPYSGISAVLQEIIRTGKTRVVIISGRDAKDVITLLGVEPHPEVWGLHGLQRIKPDGSADLSPVDKLAVEALAAADNWLRHQNLRHTAELKTGSIAVHWRGLDKVEAESIRRRVLLGWTPIARQTHVNLLEFDGGIEVRASETDKGHAVRTVMSEMNPGTPTAYLGDDNTDEHAFQAVNGRGLSVLVRPGWRQTAAQLWLSPPDEVLSFLTRWLEACLEREASGAEKTVNV